MSLFVESIRLKNGCLEHLDWHEKRLNETRSTFFPGLQSWQLKFMIDIPAEMNHGVYKCRLVYGESLISTEFIPYIPKIVSVLQLVYRDDISYDFKYEDRRCLNELLIMNNQADDVLIVKNGFVTDTSFSNIALFDGKHWYTPDTYLLNGTCRQRLIQEGALKEKTIRPADLSDFIYIRPINAMLDLNKTPNVQLILE